jgi:hypothetical protein
MALLLPLAGLDASLQAPWPRPLKMGTDCHSLPPLSRPSLASRLLLKNSTTTVKNCKSMHN